MGLVKQQIPSYYPANAAFVTLQGRKYHQNFNFSTP